MDFLTAAKKRPNKTSAFQKLWTKAEKLKRENARFRNRLDQLVQRIQTDVIPIEKQAVGQQLPLLQRLLTLGQRKSLSQRQRYMLDDWIREILDLLQGTDHLNEDIMDEVCRYDAYRLGIELDESSTCSLPEQLQHYFEREQELLQDEDEDEAYDEFDEELRESIHHEIEKILDKTLGPEPANPDVHDSDDLFSDELKAEQQRQYQEYIEVRNAAREELLKEMLAADDIFDDFDDEEAIFDFDADAFGYEEPLTAPASNDAPAVSNAVFKRLFRSIAAQLHPDREPDPNLRDQKHTLMSQLLDARKQGDVMMIIEMYQEHVSANTGLSTVDEKQLIKVLKNQVNVLINEQEQYSFETPLHRLVYEKFYSDNTKTINQVIKMHLRDIEKDSANAQALALSITSLKTLKPHLEQRDQEYGFVDSLAVLEAVFGSSR